MKAKEYDVMENAVTEGVTYGWNRAHKHNDNPSDLDIKNHIVEQVMNSIAEWFTFEDEHLKPE